MSDPQTISIPLPDGKNVLTISAAIMPLVTPAPAPAPAPKMAIGVNLPANDPLSGNAMFNNVCQAATGWYPIGNVKKSTFTTDPNGYPLVVTAGDGAAEAASWVQLIALPAGALKASWDGPAANLYVRGKSWVNLQSSNGHNTATVNFNPPGGDTYLELRSLGGVTNIKILSPDDDGKMFRKAFRDLVSPFKVLRLMPLLRVNGTNGQLPNAVWGNRVTATQWDQTSREFAYENCAQLCRETNTTPYICLPYNATDEYIAGVANIFKDFKQVYVEWSNESWNNVGQGGAYQGWNFRNDGVAKAAALGLGTGDLNQLGARYAAWCTAHLFDVWNAIAPNCFTVLSCQATYAAWAHDALTWAKVNAPGKIKMLVGAPYVQPMDGFVYISTTTMADLWTSCLQWETTYVIPGMTANAAEAKTYGCDFGVYEGPQSVKIPQSQQGGMPANRLDPGNNASANQAFDAHLSTKAQNDPGMGELHDRNFALSLAAGASLYCYFMVIGPYGRSGDWGARQVLTDPENVKTAALSRAIAASQ